MASKNKNLKKKIVVARGDSARGLGYRSHISTPEEIGLALEAFIESITTPAQDDEEKRGRSVLDPGHSGWYGAYEAVRVLDFKDLSEYKLTEALQELWKNLKKAARDMETRSYNEGLADGKNLLIGLNKGDISLSDFDKSIDKYSKPHRK